MTFSNISDKRKLATGESPSDTRTTSEITQAHTDGDTIRFSVEEWARTRTYLAGSLMSSETNADTLGAGELQVHEAPRVMSKATKKREFISGMIIRVEDNVAYVEFEKNSEKFNRIIPIEVLTELGAEHVRPGDKVGLISIRKGNTAVETRLVYFGSAVTELSLEERERLDQMRCDALKREK